MKTWSIAITLCAMALICASNASAQPIPNRQPVDFDKMPVAIEYKVEQELELARKALGNRLENQARVHFTQALELAPQRAETYFRIGQLFATSQMMQTGSTIAPRFGEARLWWEQYLEIATPSDPHWADVHAMLGHHAYNHYFSSEDAQQYRLADLQRAEYHLIRAYESYIEDQRTDRLRMDHSTYNQIELSLGVIAERFQRYDDALRYYRAAESRLLEDDIRFLFLNRRAQMWCLFWLDRDEEALAIAQNTYEYFTNEGHSNILVEHISVNLMMSTAHLKLGEFQQSLLYAAEAENMVQPDPSVGSSGPNPYLAMVKSHTANIYFEMGNLEMAENLYREAHANSERPTYKNNLAWAIVVRSEVGDVTRLEEARLLSEAAVEVSPTAANLDTLAEVYARLERYDDALELIEEALLITSSDPTLNPYLMRQRKRLIEARSGFVVSSEDVEHFRIKLWFPPTN